MVKKLTKKEITKAMKFSTHSVLKAYNHSEVEEFLTAFTPEEQRECFEMKEITLTPLNKTDIRDLSVELAENEAFQGSIMGKPQSEKLEIIRENKEIISEYIDENKYEDRLFLDKSSTTEELKWSSSNAWEVLKTHLDVVIP